MTYINIQTLIEVIRNNFALLPLWFTAWKHLKAKDKFESFGFEKHHGIPLAENIQHLCYLPFLNATSLCQLSANLPYHQRVFSYLWEKVRPRCWWNLLQSVANQWLFEDKPFPSLAQEGTVVIDDTPAEKGRIS